MWDELRGQPAQCLALEWRHKEFPSLHIYLTNVQPLLDFSYSRECLASGTACLSVGHFQPWQIVMESEQELCWLPPFCSSFAPWSSRNKSTLSCSSVLKLFENSDYISNSLQIPKSSFLYTKHSWTCVHVFIWHRLFTQPHHHDRPLLDSLAWGTPSRVLPHTSLV